MHSTVVGIYSASHIGAALHYTILAPPPLSPIRWLSRPLQTPKHFGFREGRDRHASSRQLDDRAATARVAVASDREDQPAGCCSEDQSQAAGSSSSRKRDAPGPSLSLEKRDPNGTSALCSAVLCMHPRDSRSCTVSCYAITCCLAFEFMCWSSLHSVTILDCYSCRWVLDIRQGLFCAKPSSQGALLEGPAPSPCRTCRPLPLLFIHCPCLALTHSTSGKIHL